MEDVTVIVVATLRRLLGEDFPIYTEYMDGGGFEEPSIFVQRVDMVPDVGINAQGFYLYRYNLAYFPKQTYPREDIDRMTAFLAQQFTYLDNPTDKTTEARYYAKVLEREFSVTSDQVLNIGFRVRTREQGETAPIYFDPQLEINSEVKYGQQEKDHASD